MIDYTNLTENEKQKIVKEYKKKLKEKESQEQNETVKPGMIEEDF